MIRFEWLDTDRAAVAAALRAPLARSLNELASFQEAPLTDLFGDVNWPALRPSEPMPWFEFAGPSALFEARLRPRQRLATSFLEGMQAPPLLAIFEFEGGVANLAGIRTGRGVMAVQGALEQIRKSLGTTADVRVALATEGERGAFGWVLASRGERRRFWPIFPERYGLAEGAALSAERWFDLL